MNLQEIFKRHNLRLTKERIEIFDFLEAHHLVSSAQIIEKFPRIGRASVFRTLNCFTEIGLLRRVNFGENRDLYELEKPNHHHEHMKCQKCHEILPFHSHDICNEIFQKAEEIGFSISEHQISVLGICRKCQKKNVL